MSPCKVANIWRISILSVVTVGSLIIFYLTPIDVFQHVITHAFISKDSDLGHWPDIFQNDSCWESTAHRIHSTQLNYMYEIAESPPFNLNTLKFYFVDWKNESDPILVQYFKRNIPRHIGSYYSITCLPLFGEERFFYLSNHTNRVYDLNESNVIIFGWDFSMEGRNYPCFNSRLKHAVRNVYDHTIAIHDDDGMFYYQKPNNNNCKNMTMPGRRYRDWIFSIIYTKFMKDYPNLAVFVYDIENEMHSLLEMIKHYRDLSYDRIITAKISFLNATYRSNRDISIPPPILKFYSDQTLNNDICRKRKFLLSFTGNLDQVYDKNDNKMNVRHHFNQILINSKYHYNKNDKIKIINTKYVAPKKKEAVVPYDELMLESEYLLIFSGDQQWSYRLREGLLTTNILILIGMDEYVLPFENVINYTEWFHYNGLIRIPRNEFNKINSLQQFMDKFIPKLNEFELCNAHRYNEKMMNLYFKNTVSEVNALLYSLQSRIREMT